MDEPSSPEGNAINLKIKFKSASLDDFVARYGADVSAGGIFIRTKQPLAVGTALHFDFTLGDGAPLMAGMGTVVWVREADASRVGSVPGMGVRFDHLTPEGQQTHQQILVVKAKRQERPGSSSPIPTSPFPLATAPGPRPSSAGIPVARPGTPVPGGRPSTPVPPSRPGTPVPPSRPATPVPPSPRPAAAAPISALFKDLESDSEDDFGSGGKTEIADRPPSFYYEALGKKPDQAASAQAAPSSASPAVPLDEAETDSRHVDDSRSGVPSQPVDLGEGSGGLSAPIELLDTDSQGNIATGTSSASITDLPAAASAPINTGTAPLTTGRESPWLQDALAATSEETAVPEETPSEPTQETAVGPDATTPEAPALHEETQAVAESYEKPVEGELSEVPTDDHGARREKSGKKLIIVGSVAACVAFAGVYLWMTKPWEDQVSHSEVPPSLPAAPKEAVPSPPPAQPAAPAPMPVAAEPAKPAEPVKPVAPAEAEKPVVVAEAEKPREPAAEPAKAEPASEQGKRSGASGKKSSPKSAPAPSAMPTAPAPAAAPSAAEKPAAAPIPSELVYFIKIKSVPVGAHVIMDGDPMGTTPFQRRILDIEKPHSILVRKPGFDSYERTVTKADFGAPSGNTSTLNISAKLTRLRAQPEAAAPASEEAAPAPASEQPEKL